MQEPMKAVNDYIIIEKENRTTKKVGGLLLTADIDQQIRYIKAKVVSIGNLVEGIKKGDTVHYDKHAGHGIDLNDEMYYIIQARDVVVVE